jgi:diguanylate cyclase (GGDEF)-like protein/PAS domain S-box-containing protein
VSAASARPGMGSVVPKSRTLRAEALAEAMDAGVIEEDQTALMAMANIARDRPGFHKTLDVRTRTDAGLAVVVFEIVHHDEGPVIRRATGPEPAAVMVLPVPDEPDETGPDDEGPDISGILTDTLVETPDVVAVFSSVGHEALWANDAFATLIPVRAADKIWLVDLLDEWSQGHYEVKVLPALVKYGRWRGELTLLARDATLAVSAAIVAHRDTYGEIEAISMVARPLDGRAFRPNDETRFEALVEHSSDVIAVLSVDGIVSYASPATSRILAYRDGELRGADLLALVHPDDRPASFLDLYAPDEQGIGAPVELRVQSADGTWCHLEIVVTDLSDNPAIGGIVLNARDVTERVTAVHELTERALTDALTNLPGRVRMLDRLASMMQDESTTTVVLLIDIDRVGAVNELLGRGAGDELIQKSAERLANLMTDDMFLARVGGDEFAVALSGMHDAGEGLRLANYFRQALSLPLELAGGPFDVTSSVGVAEAVAGQAPEDVLRNADRAVALAKEEGRDRTVVFDDAVAEASARRHNVEQTLRRALDHEGVRVHYQPILDVESGSVVGAEALLRVRDDDGSVLSPAEFIEAAESTGLIVRLGAQVLADTCEHLAGWAAAGSDTPMVSVNVSPRQLADPDLPTHVVNALKGSGVAPESLWLEITESILISAHPRVDASIAYLRTLGVKIGLDDFGAGHSSLGYLKRFPLDFVKIDRSLVSGLGVNEQDTAIARATIELAHNLGLIVVAVGVESSEQLEFLRFLGCDRVQGYLFAPALAPDEFASKASTLRV